MRQVRGAVLIVDHFPDFDEVRITCWRKVKFIAAGMLNGLLPIHPHLRARSQLLGHRGARDAAAGPGLVAGVGVAAGNIAGWVETRVRMHLQR